MQKIKTEKEVYVEEGQKKEERKFNAREESEKALKELDMFSDSVSSLIRHTNERINYTNPTKNCSVCECPKKKNLRGCNIKITINGVQGIFETASSHKHLYPDSNETQSYGDGLKERERTEFQDYEMGFEAGNEDEFQNSYNNA